MMGAPNLLRGGSHSGNVAASDLVDAGLLDIMSSDYAPASLLMSAVRLGRESDDMAKGTDGCYILKAIFTNSVHIQLGKKLRFKVLRLGKCRLDKAGRWVFRWVV